MYIWHWKKHYSCPVCMYLLIFTYEITTRGTFYQYANKCVHKKPELEIITVNIVYSYVRTYIYIYTI